MTRFLLVFVVVASTLFTTPVAFAATGVPKILNYQGRLMNASGVLLGGVGTPYCFKFSLFDTSVVGSGTQLWPASSPSAMTVSVTAGIFNVGIGDTNNGGDALTYNFQDSDTIYLNVDVAPKAGGLCGTFETLSPRQRVFSSSYAINANTVGGFLASQLASGNQIPVLSSGNLILAGTNPNISATLTNTLTFQGGGALGDVQFFGSSNKITSGGNATFAGIVSGASALFTNSTTTNSTVSGTASTSNLVVSNGFTFGTLTGILKTVAGVVTSALINLSTDVTGILQVANGGTGWAAIQAGAIIYGNGAGALATTTQGVGGQILAYMNGVPTWVATTTYSGGLAFTNGNVTNTGVVSATGTLSQIVVSTSTGAIVISLPSQVAISNASTTNITASGIGFFATASTTNLTLGTGSGFLQTNASGVVSATNTFAAST